MIFFRADGNSKIGSGHIMRCLSLADAAGERGIACCFVTAGAEFQEIIQAQEYRCIVLGTNHTDMEVELPALTEILNDERPEAIVVDSYFVTETYLDALRPFGKLIYIDDVAAFPYPVDMLVNYSLGAEDVDYGKLYLGYSQPQILLGPRYIPLRREFQNLDFRTPPGIIKNVLVSTGGADSEHVALRLVQYLQDGRGHQYTFHLLLGAMNQDREEIENLAQNMANIAIHKNVQNVRELMCSCDVALSAAGSTLYELCACSVPIITYILADNQIAGARKFADMGLALLVGDVRINKDFYETLLDRLDDLAGNYKLRLSMAEKAYSAVDGKGAGRIIEEVCR